MQSVRKREEPSARDASVLLLSLSEICGSRYGSAMSEFRTSRLTQFLNFRRVLRPAELDSDVGKLETVCELELRYRLCDAFGGEAGLG